MRPSIDVSITRPIKLGGGLLRLAAPAAVSNWATPAPANSGEIRFTVSGLPAAGDLIIPGDGLGSITGLEYRLDSGAWVALNHAALPLNVVLGGFLPGIGVTITLRARGSLGRPGAASFKSVVAFGTPAPLGGFAYQLPIIFSERGGFPYALPIAWSAP